MIAEQLNLLVDIASLLVLLVNSIYLLRNGKKLKQICECINIFVNVR